MDNINFMKNSLTQSDDNENYSYSLLSNESEKLGSTKKARDDRKHKYKPPSSFHDIVPGEEKKEKDIEYIYEGKKITSMLHNVENETMSVDYVASSLKEKDVFDESESDESSQKFEKVLIRTPSSFWADLRNFKEGSVPQSIVIGTAIGITCGMSAYVYYKIMVKGIDFFWHTLPETYIIDKWPEWSYPVWYPIMGIIAAIGLSLTLKFVGEPGDLAVTVEAIHSKGYLESSYVLPMICASLCTIIGGASLGPEAPLGAICASLGGSVSRHIFKQTKPNVIRKHTLMGMSGALAAFFGSPIGGTLFALEIQSRLGLEYFEHAVESFFCAELSVFLFRFCSGMSIGPIWTITTPAVPPSEPYYILIGILLGLIGAGLSYCFTLLVRSAMFVFNKLLGEDKIFARALLSASVFVTIGMFMPFTYFWSEDEIAVLATKSPAENLPNVWPTSGLIGFEMDSALNCVLVGVFKMVAIAYGIAGGFRGGFIFPLFCCGTAFGAALTFVFPDLPAPYACLCLAAAMNVAITRTSIATPIILTFLAGQQDTMSAVAAASVTSLLVTSYMVRNFEKTSVASYRNME